jgi:hypothetical protein
MAISFRIKLLIMAVLVGLAPARILLADQDVSPQVDKAIADGIAFLAKQQHPDGSSDSGGPRIAMTGLTLMSFLAAGHVPDEGRYGTSARAAMEFLIGSAPSDGYFGKVDGSRMYGHGIATLALAEAYGADHDPKRRLAARAVLIKAVDLIFKAQDVAKAEPFAGGWRYEPTNPDSDLSLSGWNALALRAAANVGIEVPKERVDRALGFVMRCYRPEQGGFAYQPGNDASIAMTGVGMLNLYLLEGPGRSELSSSANFLTIHPVTDDTRMPYYATYYSTQAAFQAGGQTWTTVWKLTQARLLPLQDKADSGWPQSPTGEEPGRVYATSMACLSLSVPYRVLPSHQR